MCVILISIDKKTRPSLETLLACQASNRDGGGVAWVENGRPQYVKNVDANFIHNILQTKKGQVVAHFRIATVGGIQPVLCHPFPIARNPSEGLSGSAKRVLFHNGTWGDWEKNLNKAIKSVNAHRPSGLFSDSRAGAVVASIKGLKAIHTFGGKFCVLSKKGAFMYNEGWVKHTDGVWYSNLHWNYRTKKYASLPRKSWYSGYHDDIPWDDNALPTCYKPTSYEYKKQPSLFDQACSLLKRTDVAEKKIGFQSDDDRLEAEYQASLRPKLAGRGGLKTTAETIGGFEL